MASRLKQIPESLLAKLWKERASREAAFRAGNGRLFRVIYPGRVGTSAGPDFRDAVLEEEGVGLVRGDVEVHVRQRDWDSHGHGKDPRYNGVVLHVVGTMDGSYSTLHSGVQVPVLSLETLLHGGSSSGRNRDLWPLLKAHGYVQPTTQAEMGAILDRAGDSRFLGKRDAFLAFLKEEDQEQVLYQGLMETLGYSQNRGPFLELAARVPYSLLTVLATGSPGEERVNRIQKLLLTAAGFLASATRSKAMGRDRWHLFRIRPQNHPRLRIMGMAHLLDLFLPPTEDSAPELTGRNRQGVAPEGLGKFPARGQDRKPLEVAGSTENVLPPWANLGLVEGMAHLVRTSSSPGVDRGPWRVIENALTGIRPPIPGKNGAREGTKAQAHIGKGRARDMAVNCVLPYLHALAHLTGDGQLGDLSLRVYRGFPGLQENEITREIRRQLFSCPPLVSVDVPKVLNDRGDKVWKNLVCNARRQQGLLHLHQLISSPVTSRLDERG